MPEKEHRLPGALGGTQYSHHQPRKHKRIGCPHNARRTSPGLALKPRVNGQRGVSVCTRCPGARLCPGLPWGQAVAPGAGLWPAWGCGQPGAGRVRESGCDVSVNACELESPPGAENLKSSNEFISVDLHWTHKDRFSSRLWFTPAACVFSLFFFFVLVYYFFPPLLFFLSVLFNFFSCYGFLVVCKVRISGRLPCAFAPDECLML